MLEDLIRKMAEAFRPNEYLDSIYQVDYASLKNKGIKGIIFDLDETLLAKEKLEISPSLFSFIEGLKDKGFSLFLLSNSSRTARIEYAAKTFNIPFSSFSMKPLPFAFDKARKIMGTKIEETVVIGDQLFMDIWGGNSFGMYTVLVKPMNPEKLWIRQLMRQAENWVLKKLELH